MKTDKQKNFEKLVSNEKSGWLDKALWRETNQSWLEKSALIAIKVLSTLKEKKISQKALADSLGVSAQYINKIVQGSENLSLETISKLENALGIKLIEIAGRKTTVNYEIPMPVAPHFYHKSMIELTWTISDKEYIDDITCEKEVA